MRCNAPCRLRTDWCPENGTGSAYLERRQRDSRLVGLPPQVALSAEQSTIGWPDDKKRQMVTIPIQSIRSSLANAV